MENVFILVQEQNNKINQIIYTMKIKPILFVSFLGRCPWGGSEELWYQSALKLQEKGFHVQACVKDWGNREHERIKFLRNLSIPVHHWGSPMTRFQRCMWFTNRVMDTIRRIPPKPPRLKIPSKAVECSLVVLNSPGNEFNKSICEDLVHAGTPYDLIIQSVSETHWPNDTKLEDFRYPFRHARNVFFVSNANLESTCCQLGFRNENFQVVSNPYQVDRDRPFEWPTGETIQFACVGRLDPEHKGQDLIFRALSRPIWRDRNWKLNLYGTGLSQRGVKDMADYLGITDRVFFHGHVRNINEIWKTNHVLLMPSRHEGLPLAVIEAMMCGRSCMVTDISGNPEHILDGINGFVAAGPTVNALGVTLERMWHQRDQLQVMGQSAYDHIRHRIPKAPVDSFVEKILSTD